MDILDTFAALPRSARLGCGIPAFFRKTLPSGLLSVQVWVKTGSIHEEEFLGGGLSHYLEHMAFKGTEKYGAEEIVRRVQAVGGSLNAYTSFDRTVYYADVPAEAAETAFDALSQIVLFPRLDARDAEREKDVILREIDMTADDPDSRLADATLAEAFRVHPYGIPVIGRKNVFSRMTSRELETYFKKRYVPANIGVAAAGDADADAIFALAEKYFGSAEERPCPAAFVPAEPPQLAPRERTLRADVRVLRGNVLWKIPGCAHADAPALSALAAILGKGDSALLWRELHEERGLVHELDVSAWMPPGAGGLFWISYAGELGDRGKIEDALLAAAARVAREGVDSALLRKVSRQAVSALVGSLGTASAAAARLGSECIGRGDPAATKIFLEKIRALTPEKIRAAAEKYFRSETLTTAALEKSAPRGKPASRAAAPRFGAFPPFEEIRLSSGVRALLQPVPGFPKVCLRASLLGGGSFETEKTRGASALLSTLMTLDAGTRTAAEIAEEIESLGGSFDEVSGNNSFSLIAETLAGDETSAAGILADAVCAPRFSEENFRRERASQLAALRGEADEIESFARLALRREFFGAHPLAVPGVGTEEALSALRLSDVEALRARLVVPENVVVAASGEFDRDALAALLEEKFSPARFRGNGAEDLGLRFAAASPGAARELEIAAPAPAEQTIVQLAFPDVGFRDERHWVGALTEELLGGMSSRLFLEVREKRGLAYFVGAERIAAPEAGMFFLCAGTARERAAATLEEMRREMRRLRGGRISAEELLGAKTRLCVALRSGRQRASSRCGNAALNALCGLPADRDAEAESRIGALTADDVARFANETLAEEFSLALTVFPPE